MKDKLNELLTKVKELENSREQIESMNLDMAMGIEMIINHIKEIKITKGFSFSDYPDGEVFNAFDHNTQLREAARQELIERGLNIEGDFVGQEEAEKIWQKNNFRDNDWEDQSVLVFGAWGNISNALFQIEKWKGEAYQEDDEVDLAVKTIKEEIARTDPSKHLCLEDLKDQMLVIRRTTNGDKSFKIHIIDGRKYAKDINGDLTQLNKSEHEVGWFEQK